MDQPYDVIGLGELLWDLFPGWETDPAKRKPGGAPANVAFHAQQLGHRAAVATRVGRDDLGTDLLAFLERQGLSTNLVQRDAEPNTGTVTVEPRDTGTTYTFREDSAWDRLAWTPDWQAALATTRAVAYGTLAQRNPLSRATIQAAVAATTPSAWRVYDINLRPPFYDRATIDASLRLARVAKLNHEEVPIVAELLSAPVRDVEPFARWLRETYRLDLVCVTRGGDGALAVSATEIVDAPGIPTNVVDTVGAGDAFTAGLIHGLLEAWPLDRTLPFANRLGALVASHPGAMPILTIER
jgi:fructokinase